MSTSGYHNTRLSHDLRRDILWQSLWKFYFCKLIEVDDCVVDLGCGYGNFINSVVAKRRIAIDNWSEFPQFIHQDIEVVVGSITDLDFLTAGAIDFAFASNIIEHISQDDFRTFLINLRNKLSSKGTLTILQPNFRYAYREYFDDYTHVSVFSHISLCDFLVTNGYEIIDVQPRFLPLTLKSRLPVFPFLIRAYLKSPIKPLGKQMLVRAKPI